MTATIKYKGSTLATADNSTKTLLTAGKYLEDDITVTDVTSGGGSSWTKVGTTWELAVANYTSTSAVSAGSKTYNSTISTKDKIIWVRIRDKAGKRAGYFAGSDTFFINTNRGNGSTSTYATAGRFIHRYTTSNAWATYIGNSGVYGYSISSAGNLVIRKAYSSTNSLTIDGTYLVDVFILDYPTGYPAVFDMADYVPPEE